MKTKRFHGIHTHLTAWVAALAILLSALPAEAQEDYRFDIGGGIGTTGYLGDANTANLYKNPYEIGEQAEFNFFPYGIGEKYRKLKRWTPYIAAGLGFTLWSTDGKAHFGVNIPLGIGIKFKVNKRLNLGMEFLMKKVFSDKLDGDSLSDPYQIKSSFAKNTDWYSTLTFTISYEFSKRCAVCNYKER